MAARPLSPKAVKRAADTLGDDLGRTDRIRLEVLLGLLADDGRISLADALQALFPDQAREAALTAFRQFRSRLREIVAELGVRFSLQADSQTRAAPEERWCWFEGDDGAVEAATRLAMEETGHVERSGQSAIELTETRDGKPLIRYFVSYAHQDKSESEKLLWKLQNQLDIAKDYAFEAWTDRDLLPGEGWHEEIQGAIARCQFGLLLVSVGFLGSKYITAHELPSFVAGEPGTPDPGKRAIPVALKRVLLDGSMDLKGLEGRQIFHDNGGRAFSERTTDKTREDFARELFQKILAVVAGCFTVPPTPTVPRALSPRERAERAQRRYIDEVVDWGCHVPTQGFASALHKLESEPEKPAAEVLRADALAFLDDWVGNPQAQPYCALLGELGMGKTTTCMAFARSLLERRKHDPAAPLPIYLDLRHLGDRAKGEPELKQILESVLVKSWRGGHGEPDLTADEAIRLVQSEGAVAIFDGLDEVLVHLSAAGGQRFVREVFRLLPPVRRAGKAQRGANPVVRPGRLLMACRTHFFRTLREQKNFFTAEDRDGVRAEDYRAFVLLPFSEEQIRGYLAQTLPDQDPGRVLDLIRAVHNLSEMAERPYTLSLISRHIPQIERWKLEGRSVTGVMLYRHMVLSWLERDDGKHQILPDHKRRLMEYLAAELWRAGRRVWSVGELEQWLIDVLARRPDVAAHYDGKERELLKEDLRTATFLVREGEDSFRFAHTSLQEFFLAGYLLEALLQGKPEAWVLPMPSPETLDFLGQLLAEEAGSGDKALMTLRELRDTWRPRASELAFSYALLAVRKGYPAPSTAGFRLEGADLRDCQISGRENEARVNLRGACLRGARLSGAELSHLDLEGADFSGADLSRSEWFSIRAPEVSLTGTQLAGAVFRQCNLTQANFGDSRFHRTTFLFCHLSATIGLVTEPPAALLVAYEPSDPHLAPDASTDRVLSLVSGHAQGARACAWSPDGSCLASASRDGTLRLWDVQSGEPLLVLRGHEGGVTACAWSPDGHRLASASIDGTLRLWDVERGQSVVVLRGHEQGMRACVWSPDGCLLVSASEDGTLRLWDVASGESLLMLRGHKGGVTACAWSPDGSRIASASSDRTLRLWDAATGESMLKLRGHGAMVTVYAWSPDGSRMVSASNGTLRLWDAASGDSVLKLHGHYGLVMACAWSPDGRRLAVASWDETLRLCDVGSGETLRALRGHEERVTACAWSPDGSRLASASLDGTLRLWDVASGESLLVLRGHEKGVAACAWSSDGSRLASASWDGTLRLWDAATGAPLGLQIHFFNSGAWASLDLERNRIIEVHGDAWRWLGWRVRDRETDQWEMWPAETFGALPSK